MTAPPTPPVEPTGSRSQDDPLCAKGQRIALCKNGALIHMPKYCGKNGCGVCGAYKLAKNAVRIDKGTRMKATLYVAQVSRKELKAIRKAHERTDGSMIATQSLADDPLDRVVVVSTHNLTPRLGLMVEYPQAEAIDQFRKLVHGHSPKSFHCDWPEYVDESVEYLGSGSAHRLYHSLLKLGIEYGDHLDDIEDTRRRLSDLMSEGVSLSGAD